MNLQQFRKLESKRQQKASSVSAFCKEHSIPQSRYYYWKRKSFQSEQVGFLELKPTASSCPSIQLELPSGSRIHLSPGFDEDLLRQVMRVLG